MGATNLLTQCETKRAEQKKECDANIGIIHRIATGIFSDMDENFDEHLQWQEISAWAARTHSACLADPKAFTAGVAEIAKSVPHKDPTGLSRDEFDEFYLDLEEEFLT